jgi:hypothetical protein
MQRRRQMEFLEVAIATGRTAVLRPLYPSYDAVNQTLRFEDLFDLEYFREQLADVLSVTTEQPEAPAIPWNGSFDSVGDLNLAAHEHLTYDMTASHESKLLQSLQLWSPPFADYRNLRRRLSLAYRPREEVLQAVDWIVSKLTSNGSAEFGCLHLRTEPDFQSYFVGPPGYYNETTILQKLQGSGWHTRYPRVYVTGSHSSAIRGRFAAAGLWSEENVHTKDDLVQALSASSGHMRPLLQLASVLATIDFMVCSRATSFVGNNHSAWSELLFDLLMYRGLPLHNTAQVNDIELGGVSRDNLVSPFCSSNAMAFHGISCPYVRER